MKKILGIVILVVGVCASLYFGGWVMFVGGIAGLIDIIKLGNFDGMIIAKNVAKIVFASATTSIGVCLSVLVGSGLMYSNKRRKFKKW